VSLKFESLMWLAKNKDSMLITLIFGNVTGGTSSFARLSTQSFNSRQIDESIIPKRLMASKLVCATFV
jgi:hypothetical protein